MEWYTSKPIGINELGGFMKNISKRLSLSKIYTNHCIRATTVTVLSAEGLEARHIMRVTGHRCESSLRSYDHDNTIIQKRKISEILARRSKSNFKSIAVPVVTATSTSYSDSSFPMSSSTSTTTSEQGNVPPLHCSRSSNVSGSSSSNANTTVACTTGSNTNTNIESRSINLNKAAPCQHFVITNNNNCNFYFNSK